MATLFHLARHFGAFTAACIATAALSAVLAVILSAIHFFNYSNTSPLQWITSFVPMLAVMVFSYQWLRAELERSADQERIHRLSNFDATTGLLSRSSFEKALRTEIERSARYQASLCILLVDIENFSALNQTAGRAVGNFALQNLADICTDTTREFDYVCRFSGGQIALILPETTAHDAKQIAQRIHKQTASANLVFDHRTLTLKVLVGGAFGSCDEIIDTDTLIDRAEQSLDQAKSKTESDFDQVIIHSGASTPPANSSVLAKAS